MRITRLSWAGVRIEHAGLTLVIDPLENVERLTKLGLGEPRDELVPIAARGSVDLALVTHRHPDHFDATAVNECLRTGGVVACPTRMVKEVSKRGMQAQPFEPFETREFGSLSVTAVPAVDGLGDSQVSWIVDSGGTRVFHCGDTLWHGHWWRIAHKCGDVTVAFLPINGAIVEFAGLASSGIPVCMTPEQAAAAAKLVGAKVACPIHYSLFDNPPTYAETKNAPQRFRDAGVKHGVSIRELAPGETLSGS